MRIIVDTNVLIESFSTALGPAAQVIELIQSDHVELLLSQDILQEYRHMLFALYPEHQDRLRIEEWLQSLPLLPRPHKAHVQVADPSDQKFIDLLVAEEADALVTLDAHLLDANWQDESLPIMTPRDWIHQYRRLHDDDGETEWGSWMETLLKGPRNGA